MSHLTLHRRQVLQLLGTAAVLPALGAGFAQAQETSAARMIVLSDLHSAYERTAQLLAAIEAEIAASDAPAAILINGDVFELGNVVATRSGAEIDWAFLARLASLAPTVLNIGNHEPDIENDLAIVIAQANDLGITVLSNIVDARTGAPLTDAAATLDLGGLPVRVIGIATHAITTYPAPTRELIEIPDPAVWARENLAAALEGDAFPVVLSHAGVIPDRDAILPLLADGGLLIGGHDHLILDHSEGDTRYIHTGSWSSLFTVAEISADGAVAIARRAIDLDAPADAELAALIAATLDAHLTDEERAVVGASPAAQTLSESARFVAATMAETTGADIGFIGHTTFGTGFPAGDVDLYTFNSVVRFDGTLVQAEVDAGVLEEILARANQDGDIALAARTGDFLYAAPDALEAKDTYTIVTNDWSAINQASYFGREDLEFTEVPDLRVKALVIEALSGN